jgi:hypothetical protein
MRSATPEKPPTAPSAWSLLRAPVFRALWIASLVSNAGDWMQDVGSARPVTAFCSAAWARERWGAPRCCRGRGLIESWGEHLRQHERLSVADHAIEQRALTFHVGEGPPKVTQYVAEPPPAA